MRKIMLLFVTAALAVVSAATASYALKIDTPTWVGNTELKAGNYRLHVEGDKAVIRQGKKTLVEVGAAMEEAPTKYSVTALLLDKANAGKPKLQEVHVGGTHTRILIKN